MAFPISSREANVLRQLERLGVDLVSGFIPKPAPLDIPSFCPHIWAVTYIFTGSSEAVLRLCTCYIVWLGRSDRIERDEPRAQISRWHVPGAGLRVRLVSG